MVRAATEQQSQHVESGVDTAEARLPFDVDGVSWIGDAQILRELRDLAATPSQLNERPCVTTIKSGPHRAVYRVELPSGTIFLKHCKAADWQAQLRNLVRRTPAEREARAAQLVTDAGVDTVTSVAVGRQSQGLMVRDSFLATRALVDVRPLDELIRDPTFGARRTPAFRRGLARALGGLCGRLHRAGLVHRDLHPGNLLAQVDQQNQLRLTLIDLQRIARFSLTLSPISGIARRDLFGLFNSFQKVSSRSDRWRFFASYSTEIAKSQPRPMHRRQACQLEAFCRRALVREQLRNDKKWQRANRRLIVADSKNVCCRGLTVMGANQVLELRSNPDSLFRRDRVRFWLRRTPAERAAVINLWTTGETICCEARETNRALGWRDFLPGTRWSTMRRAWEMGHALRRRGISTVRTLLYLESRSVARVRESLIWDRSGNSVPLPVFLTHQLPGMPTDQQERWLKQCARGLANELRKMREFSLVHQQFSAADVLVGAQTIDCTVQIGGAGHIHRRQLSMRRHLVSALAQFTASLAAVPGPRRTHCLRFLKCYLGTRSTSQPADRQWKSWWHSIAQAQPQAQRSIARVSQHVPRQSLPERAARAAVVWLIAGLLFCGCNAVERPIALPVRHQVKAEQLLVLSDFKLQKDHELIRELTALREQVSRALDLPLQRDPVVVYLFNNETEYRRYMAITYPKLPPRSAYFVGTSTELAVYTHWGQSVREDLRHEYTHGLLHSAMKRVPLWLDEGLAEYFEVAGPRPGGINREYATKLSTQLARGWRPDMKRLEALDDNAAMRRADYQESWAWVHYMLHSTPDSKQVLLSYLKDLQTIPDPKPISRRLKADIPDFEERSVVYMSHLATEHQVADRL